MTRPPLAGAGKSKGCEAEGGFGSLLQCEEDHIHDRSGSLSEAWDHGVAEREARQIEQFVQGMALAVKQAAGNDLPKAAALARGLATAAVAYRDGVLILSGETVAALGQNDPEQKRVTWASGRIEGAIKKLGKDDVADVLELLAQIFSEA